MTRFRNKALYTFLYRASVRIFKAKPRGIIALALSLLFFRLLLSSTPAYRTRRRTSPIIESDSDTIISHHASDIVTSHDISQNMIICQKLSGKFPCMDILDRIRTFDSQAFWFNKSLSVDDRHLKVDFVNKELKLEFTLKYQNYEVPKYYEESAINNHRDARYFDDEAKIDFHKTLVDLYKAWSYFASDYDIQEWWIAHGNLLSWSWNSIIFPWDFDDDIQVSLYSLGKLWKLNSTLYDKQFLLDVNPHARFRTYRDINNVIDARFIDTHSGAYIDITALTDQSIGYDLETMKVLNCKSPHWYSHEDVFPLRATVYSNVPVWRPNNPIAMLAQEYNEKGMTNRKYRRWTFTDDQVWRKP